MPKCQDVMSRNVVCCLRTDTALQAARMMRDENVGSIPVVEDHQNKRLVGIVTDRDLAMNIVAEGRNPDQIKVEEVMTGDPISCRPSDDVTRAMDAMATHQVRRIPVVDEDKRIVGIIAQADIATRIERPTQTAEVVEEISKPG